MTLATSRKSRPPLQIRDLRESDLPQVAQLWQRVFRHTAAAPPRSLLAYMQEVFFQNPWRDDELASLVCVSRDGTLAGFLGVLPRTMLFRGQPIRAAVSTQWMVNPDPRFALVGVELMRRFFDGPQDLSLTDGANDISARLWEGLGGQTALLYSMDWLRVLRPARWATGVLSQRKGLRLLRAMHPLCRLADAVAGRLPLGPWRTRPAAGLREEATVPAILNCWNGLSPRPALCPAYDPESIAWLLRMAAAKTVHGQLRRVLVRTEKGRAVGWFLYYLQPGGISRLVQLVADAGTAGQVLDHLFVDARAAGAAAVSGRLDPAHVQELSNHHCTFACKSRGVLVHSRHAELLHAIHRGDSFLSRLDGEWWMRFGSDPFE